MALADRIIIDGPNGRYSIAEGPGFYQVQEAFGAYRIGKKRFKTEAAAIERAKRLAGTTEGGAS